MNLRLRTLLVDDEPPARERLATLLREHPQIEIIGEAGDVKTAAEFCALHQPDLIFLDIQLPRANGFELLPRLARLPHIIFVTAYDRFAVRAFEVNALDYLMKPVHPERLALSLARLPRPGGAGGAGGETVSPERVSGTPLVDGDLISLQEDRRLRMVPLRSIAWIEADGNFTRVHVTGGPPAFIRRTVAQWQQLLPPALFVRLDRSVMIRLGAVRRLQAESREKVLVEVEGLVVSLELRRRAALRLRQALDQA